MMGSHTLKYIHTNEYFSYKVLNRDIYDIWKNKDKPSIMDNAKIITEEIIKGMNQNYYLKIYYY